MSPQKRGLGKGLNALLSTSNQSSKEQAVSSGETLRNIPIDFLQPGKYQPRRDMSSDALDELASSIRSQGIIQPIVIRQLGNQKYEIIAGERRWRAAQQAQIREVPCIIKDVDDEAAVAIALIENIQREDLNAMEEAMALERLINEFELTHQQVAEAVGKSRSTVSNLLRLNSLEPEVKTMLEHGDIEMGHARALLALNADVQVNAARAVVAKELTVRETERFIQKLNEGEQVKLPTPKEEDPDIVSLQESLSEILGSSVQIKHKKSGKGKLIIDYSTSDEINGIIARLKRSS